MEKVHVGLIETGSSGAGSGRKVGQKRFSEYVGFVVGMNFWGAEHEVVNEVGIHVKVPGSAKVGKDFLR